MPILIIAILAVGAVFFVNTKSSEEGVSMNLNLKDIDPVDQSGDYDTQYDDAFKAGNATCPNVPFALMKAHAVRESALNPKAVRHEIARNGRPPSDSYGLMQLLWWKNSGRFTKYGFPDDAIGDGSLLYDPTVNCVIAAQLINDNLKTFGNLRDTVNAYNTGVAEKVRIAPGNYVNDVLKIYSTIVGESVS